MKKTTILMTFFMFGTQIMECTNWIIWLKNESDFKVEGQSIANNPNYIEIQGAPGDYRTNVFTLQPHVQFQSKNFPLPWAASNQALYLTVHTQSGPQYYKLYEQYNPVSIGGAAAGGYRSARVEGPNVSTNKKIDDNWELTVVINKAGIPEIRGKNFEVLS